MVPSRSLTTSGSSPAGLDTAGSLLPQSAQNFAGESASWPLPQPGQSRGARLDRLRLAPAVLVLAVAVLVGLAARLMLPSPWQRGQVSLPPRILPLPLQRSHFLPPSGAAALALPPPVARGREPRLELGSLAAGDGDDVLPDLVGVVLGVVQVRDGVRHVLRGHDREGPARAGEVLGRDLVPVHSAAYVGVHVALLRQVLLLGHTAVLQQLRQVGRGERHRHVRRQVNPDRLGEEVIPGADDLAGELARAVSAGGLRQLQEAGPVRG